MIKAKEETPNHNEEFQSTWIKQCVRTPAIHLVERTINSMNPYVIESS